MRILVFIFSFLPLLLFGQEQVISWQKSMGGQYNENAYALTPTPDGGYILVGGTHSKNSFDVGDSRAYEGNGGSDFWVVKINKKGDILWQKTFGGTKNDIATGIVRTVNGEYMIIGSSVSTDGEANFNGPNGGLVLVRIKEDGTMVSSRVIPGGFKFNEPTYTYTDNFSKPSIVTLPGGDLMIGATREIGQSPFMGKQFYLARLTPTGDTLWERIFGTPADEYMNDLVVTNDGSVLMVGSTTAFARDLPGAGNGFYDFLVIKASQTGIELWRKAWGGNTVDVLYAGMELRENGNYIFVGETASNTGVIKAEHEQKDAFIFSLNQNGTMLWSKAYGGNGNEAYYDLVDNYPSGYLAIGTSDSQIGNVKPKGPLTDVFVTNFDRSGTAINHSLYGGADIDLARAGHSMGPNELLLVGTSRSESEDLNKNFGENDFWVFKLAPPPPLTFGRIYVNLEEGKDALVEWSTTRQRDAKLLTLEKSTDNKTFKGVREYDVTENTSSLQLFSYLDKFTVIGKNYYRLKYTDIANNEYIGPSTVFEFVPLSSQPEQTTPEIQIYPNPVQSTFKIDGLSSTATLKLISQAGVHVPFESLKHSGTAWEASIKDETSPGIYFLSVRDGEIFKALKLVIL